MLYHANGELFFGVDMMKELKRHGCSASPGLMYPTLHSLEKNGYPISEKRTVNGKMRRYYPTTSQGEGMLMEAHSKIHELMEEAME